MSAPGSREGRDTLAALDPLLSGGRDTTTPASPLVSEDLLTPATSVLGLIDPAAGAVGRAAADWAREQGIVAPSALAKSAQADTILANYRKMWDRTVGSGDVGDYLTTVGALLEALVKNPEEFVDSFHDAAITAFTSQIVDTWEYLAGVARWALQMTECRHAVELSALKALALEDWAALELDDEACAWLRDFVDQTAHTLAKLERFWEQATAWQEALRGQPTLLLDAYIIAQEFALEVVDAVLADQTYYEWLQSRAEAGPKVLGGVSGAIVGFVAFQALWAWVGGWVGELGIAGKVLWELAEAPLPTLPSEETDEPPHQRARATTSGRRAGAVSADEINKRVAKYFEMLGPDGRRLLHAITEAARRAEGSLTRKITDPRLRAIIEALDADPTLVRAADQVRHAVGRAFGNAYLAFGRHADMKRWGAHVNQGANSLGYLGLIRQEKKQLDRAEEIIHSVGLLTRVFDAAHAIDQQHWPKVKPIFNAAGIPWQTTDDIYSMLLSNADHRSNPLRSLAEASGLDETHLGSFNECQSLTGRLNERITWDPKPKNPKKGWHYLGEVTNGRPADEAALKIIAAFEDVWRDWATEMGVEARHGPARKRIYDAIRALITQAEGSLSVATGRLDS